MHSFILGLSKTVCPTSAAHSHIFAPLGRFIPSTTSGPVMVYSLVHRGIPYRGQHILLRDLHRAWWAWITFVPLGPVSLSPLSPLAPGGPCSPMSPYRFIPLQTLLSPWALKVCVAIPLRPHVLRQHGPLPVIQQSDAVCTGCTIFTRRPLCPFLPSAPGGPCKSV